MKPIVERKGLREAHEEIGAHSDSLSRLGESEPYLRSYISDSLITLAGRLALSGVTTEIVQGVHADVLEVLLTSIQALRHGHYAEQKHNGTARPELDPSFRSDEQADENPAMSTSERRIGF